MRKIFYLLILAPLLAVSCSDDIDYEFDRFTIASELRYMDYGGSWADGYVVSVRGNNQWGYFPHEIEGFTYTPGKEYLVHLKVYDAKDESGVKYKRYVLYRLFSEVVKESQNLPTDERGTMTIASQMRMDAKGANAKKCYAVKFPEPDDGGDGEDGEDGGDKPEWQLIDMNFIIFDGYEAGGEYEIEYLKSNVSRDNITGTGDYYRVIKSTKTTAVSENLPGEEVPEGK